MTRRRLPALCFLLATSASVSDTVVIVIEAKTLETPPMAMLASHACYGEVKLILVGGNERQNRGGGMFFLQSDRYHRDLVVASA
jgi:hypothetical protein